MPEKIVNKRGRRRPLSTPPGTPIPYAKDLHTGELYEPRTDLVSGLGCNLYCPTCLDVGRPKEDAEVVFYRRGRRGKSGGYSGARFQHRPGCAPSDPAMACYRKNEGHLSAWGGSGGGGPETLVHALTGEFLCWWYDGVGDVDDVWEATVTGGRYPGSLLRYDACCVSATGTVYWEVEVTHRIERAKRDYLNTLPAQVWVVDLSDADDREFMHDRLKRWDFLTITEGAASTEEAVLAKEIFDYLETNALKEFTNDHYYR